MINKQSDKNCSVDCLEIDNLKTFQTREIANEFGKYFSTVGNEFASKITKPKNNLNHYLSKIPCMNDSLFLNPTSQSEINKIIHYVEVTGVKTGYPGRQHRHGEPSHTVCSAPPDLSMGQPVFPSPVPQLVPESQSENVDQGMLNFTNIVSTGHAEAVQNVDNCPPDIGDVATTIPPPPPPDSLANQNIPLPPVATCSWSKQIGYECRNCTGKRY